MWKRFWIVAAVTLATGCSTNLQKLQRATPAVTSASTAEAAQVSLDIASISHWQDVAAHFQPAYGLTGTAAVAMVNRTSSYDTAALTNSTSGGVSVEADGSIVSRDASRTATISNANGVTTQSSTATNSSDAKQATPAAPAAAQAPSSTYAPAQFASQTPSLAPTLNIQSGDSLFKYAAVLDQGFGQIAPCGFVPILITFRVTVSANKRNQPYDTVMDVSLLPEEFTTPPAATDAASAERPSDTVTASDRSGGKLSHTRGSPTGQPATAAAAYSPDSDNPYSCPAPIPNDKISIVSFSSDSLENGQNDFLSQQSKALALAAAVRAGIAAASANFQKLSAAIDHSLSLRPNSLVSVARTGDSTFHIRLGANRFATEEYEMLSLDHLVSIVLLVPFQTLSRNLTAIGHYYFEDARGAQGGVAGPEHDADTTWLQARSSYLHDVAATELYDYPSEAGNAPALRRCAVSAADCGNLARIAESLPNQRIGIVYRALFSTEQPSADQVRFASRLLARLSKVSLEPGVTSVTRALPESLRICPPTDITVPAVDDGINATATVSGADGYQGAHITAELTLWRGTTKQRPATATSFASGFDIGGPDLGDLKFPSFAKVLRGSGPLTGILQFWGRDNLACPAPSTGTSYYPVAYSAKATPGADKTKAMPSITGISAYPADIVEVGGAGTMGFSVDLGAAKADAVEVSVDQAAQLTSVSGAAPKAGKVTIAASGDFQAQLANLRPGTKFNLKLSFKAAGKVVQSASIKVGVAKG